ncbi:hypothetical protein [Nocardia carnea]|uniref:hypothetical protein n=1 Tax=Nocardia carnea TaxID=37328 RepID=UPI0024552BBB|nr:hypothetical protein [Nocardia carnea]
MRKSTDLLNDAKARITAAVNGLTGAVRRRYGGRTHGLRTGPAGELSQLDLELARRQQLSEGGRRDGEVMDSSTEVPRAGESGPILLSGRRALDELVVRYGDRIAFHGSHAPIHLLEPRQTSWGDSTGRRYPDGSPAVCADADYDIPMFIALFKSRPSPNGIDVHEDGTVDYKVAGAGSDDWSEYTGYVHVVDKTPFELVELDVPEGWPHPLVAPRTPEWRATSAVEPFAIV